MSYLPTNRWDKGEIYEQSELVIVGSVQKIIPKKYLKNMRYQTDGKVVPIQILRYRFYAVVEIIHKFKGQHKKETIEVYLGVTRGTAKYKDCRTHNTQPRYFAKLKKTYLLELIKTENGYEPLAYWSSILELATDEKGDIYFIHGAEYKDDDPTKLTLKEYEEDRNIKLNKLHEFTVNTEP